MKNVFKKSLSVILALVFVYGSCFSLIDDFGCDLSFSVVSEAAVVDINSLMYAVREPVNCSGKLTYTIYLKKGISVDGVTVNVAFDKTKLEAVSGGEYSTEDEDGNLIQSVSGLYVSGVTVSDANLYAIAYMSMSPITLSKDKPFMFVTFKVKDKYAKSSVEIRCIEFNSGNDDYDINKTDSYVTMLSETIENIVPAHSFSNLNLVKATCESEGRESGLCTSCGEYIDEVIPALGHYYEKGACTLCGEELPFEYSIIGDKVTIMGYKGTSADVIIPKKIDGCEVTSIGSKAFSTNETIGAIHIPDTVTDIGAYAFYKCPNLTAINVDINNEYYSSIDGVLFNYKGDVLIQYPCAKANAEYAVPDSVSFINPYAFYACNNIVSLATPDSLTELGEYAFAFCNNMASFTMGNSVETIGAYAFRSCTSLTSLDISAGVTSIGNNAFENCKSLLSIKIPDRVTDVGSKTFYACYGLVVVELPDTLITIGEKAFGSCTSLDYLFIPRTVQNISPSAFENCKSLYMFDVANDNSRYSDVGGVLFNKDKTELIKYPALGIDSKYVVPETVNKISDRAFEHTKYLSYITITDNVSDMGDNVFFYSSAVIKCAENSAAHEYAVANNVDYILFKIYEKNGTVIDYTRGRISTTVENASDITDFLNVVDNSSVSVESRYEYGDCVLLGTGAIISIYEGNEIIDEFSLVVSGDTNGDSVCDAIDGSEVALVSNGVESFDWISKLAADLNGDNSVDAEDYQAVINKIIT